MDQKFRKRAGECEFRDVDAGAASGEVSLVDECKAGRVVYIQLSALMLSSSTFWRSPMTSKAPGVKAITGYSQRERVKAR